MNISPLFARILFICTVMMLTVAAFAVVEAHSHHHHHHSERYFEPKTGSKFDHEPDHVRKALQQEYVGTPLSPSNSHNHDDLFDGVKTKCPYSDPDMVKKLEGDTFEKRPTLLNKPLSEEERIHRRRASARNDDDAGFDNIRIYPSYLDLYNSNNYCTAAGQTKNDLSGGTRTCTATQVFTAAKRDLLENTIIPYAVAKIQRALKVERFTDPLQSPSRSICFGGWTIPQSYVSPGLADTDYLLLIGAAPTHETTNDGSVVAFASACAFTNEEPIGRAGIGRANFNPTFLDLAKTPIQNMLRTALHEILHAFYMSGSYLNAAGLLREMTVRGEKRVGIISPWALQTARNYFNCPDLVMIELEDDGGSGTAGSHMERRMFKESLMAGTGGAVFNAIELAIARDVGLYRVNWTEADPMFFGRNAGCGFITDTSCPVAISKIGDSNRQMFCDNTVPSPDCTANLEGYGPCVSSSSFLADGCRFFSPYSDAKCTETSYGNVTSLGESFHRDSRCYQTSGSFKKTGSSSVSFTQRCIQTRCIVNMTPTVEPPSTSSNGDSNAVPFIVEFRVGDQDTWYACSTENEEISISGYDGTVRCPTNLREMCASYLTTGFPLDEVNAELKQNLLHSSGNAVPQNTEWSMTTTTTTPSPNVFGGGNAGKISIKITIIAVCASFLFSWML